MRKLISYSIRAAIGIGILAVALYSIGIGSIASVLSSANIALIAAGVVIALLLFFVEAFNVALLAWTIKSFKFSSMVKYYLMTWSINLVIPAGIGHFSMVYFLKREGIPMGPGTAVVLVDKFTTFLTLFLVSLFGLGIFFTRQQSAAIIITAALLVCIAGFLLVSATGRALLRKLPFASKFAGFYSALSSFSGKHILPVLLNTVITLAKWLAVALMIKLFLLSVGAAVPYNIILIITCMVVLLAYIPVSIAGLGIRETSAAFFYSVAGVAAETAIAVYIINLVLNYAMAAIIFIALGHEIKGQAD